MKYSLKIENLACANCGAKIERALKQSPHFKAVELNFLLKQIKVETSSSIGLQDVIGYIQEVANSYEEGIIVEEEKQEKPKKYLFKWNKDLTKITCSTILFILAIVSKINMIYVVAYLIIGYEVLLTATKKIAKGKMLDESFLMTIASLGAFAIGEYPEAVAVMLFYEIGEYLQHRAVDYSTRAIEEAMDIRPDFARVVRKQIETVHPSEVSVGEIIEIKVGEKIPIDGKVIEGSSFLDVSMLTGESMPIEVTKGSEVLSGSINQHGILRIETTKNFEESTVSKILTLMKEASSQKSQSEQFITKFAKWYTPIVVILAIIIAIIPSLLTGNWHTWIYSAIVFLVVSCPCALVVSIPLGFFGGLGASSKRGILIKGSQYLEAVNKIDTVVLDKTGTITKGEFGVVDVITDIQEEELLTYAALLESYSNHPIARSIVEYYGKEKIPKDKLTDYVEKSGYGVAAYIKDDYIIAGNEKWMKEHEILYTKPDCIGSYIYVAKNKEYLGCIVIADKIKQDSADAIKKLKKLGIKKIMMLTGDEEVVAKQIGEQVGVDEIHAKLLPQDKVYYVERELEKGKVVFVGDGMNDAPVLARATVGVAMGGVGSDAAIEAADIVLLEDSLMGVADTITIARTTRKIVIQNIVFALGVKGIILLLGALGIANMWEAVFADVGVSILAILNALRVLYSKK